VFKDKRGKSIYLRDSEYEPNENSILRCEKSDHGIISRYYGVIPKSLKLQSPPPP